VVFNNDQIKFIEKEDVLSDLSAIILRFVIILPLFSYFVWFYPVQTIFTTILIGILIGIVMLFFKQFLPFVYKTYVVIGVIMTIILILRLFLWASDPNENNHYPSYQHGYNRHNNKF